MGPSREAGQELAALRVAVGKVAARVIRLLPLGVPLPSCEQQVSAADVRAAGAAGRDGVLVAAGRGSLSRDDERDTKSAGEMLARLMFMHSRSNEWYTPDAFLGWPSRVESCAGAPTRHAHTAYGSVAVYLGPQVAAGS
ncbi:hypothetical protein TSOC_008916 [Tetrabaena socialis]|uniref:Uncharacterized protein n=1 Tax=Tetrabaena socialis TaxID=47790 RepID=A0A2J7ZX23_9CHLO|nr:hypothetical protein TSOC_008916 [Tetrabaena socialis]|eukprot:PNH04823.1 hypothetical protein TSOC_008916 [Tetrabaena socialis]